MELWNLRSLLLAAIVLSNCIPWASSRHHYSHNMSRHRSRHRRQGAGLYLPATYVIPGGEGSGPWGDWAEVSPCSRTCGGGVAYQKRICLDIGPDGRPRCFGGNTKYISCETQDCPAGSTDFRAEQCAYYNTKSFRGDFYDWVPYTTKDLNPCELNCKPRGERFYYRHKQKVIDGTRCNYESFDVCVDGICQPAGCDMMLGSSSREDKCRECRGNGSNCETQSGIIDSQDYIQGYNDILLIPEYSTTVVIEEIRESNNYLALRNQNRTYYLNGDYKINMPGKLEFNGMKWIYERRVLGFRATNILRCQGPTTEPLYLSLLLMDVNVGVKYEYSLPKGAHSSVSQKYHWVYEAYSECSTTCGGGIQTRNVSCRTDEALDVVDEKLCDKNFKPVTSQPCNVQACAPYWNEGPWTPCSKRCGSGGVKSRTVQCEKVITQGFPSIVSDDECFNTLGTKPSSYAKCNEGAKCPSWFTGPWQPCDKLCGEGKQTRQVVCYQKVDGKVEVLEDGECQDEKPAEHQTCMLQLCFGVDWVVTDWSGCDTCLSTVRTRVAFCASDDGDVVNASLCSHHPMPVLEEPCDSSLLPPCQTQWYATQWGKCSVECGKGVQSRVVFCGKFNGASVMMVEDSMCNGTTKYNNTKPCEVPPEDCPAKWFAGPWAECNKKCGGGAQDRKVMCLNGDEESMDCDGNLIPEDTQACNIGPCNADEILPLNSTSPIIDDDDYEDCEDYPEFGAEEILTSFTDSAEDVMLSDSPSTPEGSRTSPDIESEFDLGSGSGFGGFTSTSDESDYYTTDDIYSTGSSEDGSTDYTGSTENDLSSSSETKDYETSTESESEKTETNLTESSNPEENTSKFDTTTSDLTKSSEADSTVTEASEPETSASNTTETSVTDKTSETSLATNTFIEAEETSETSIDISEPSSVSSTETSGSTSDMVTVQIDSSTSPTSDSSPLETETPIESETETSDTEPTIASESITENSSKTEITDGSSLTSETTESTEIKSSSETSETDKITPTTTSDTAETLYEATKSTDSSSTDIEITHVPESTISSETSRSEVSVTDESSKPEVSETTETNISETTVSGITGISETSTSEEPTDTISSEKTDIEVTTTSESSTFKESGPTETVSSETMESEITAPSESSGTTEPAITDGISSESTELEVTLTSGSSTVKELGTTETVSSETMESEITPTSESSSTKEPDTTGSISSETTEPVVTLPLGSSTSKEPETTETVESEITPTLESISTKELATTDSILSESTETEVTSTSGSSTSKEPGTFETIISETTESEITPTSESSTTEEPVTTGSISSETTEPEVTLPSMTSGSGTSKEPDTTESISSETTKSEVNPTLESSTLKETEPSEIISSTTVESKETPALESSTIKELSTTTDIVSDTSTTEKLFTTNEAAGSDISSTTGTAIFDTSTTTETSVSDISTTKETTETLEFVTTEKLTESELTKETESTTEVSASTTSSETYSTETRMSSEAVSQSESSTDSSATTESEITSSSTSASGASETSTLPSVASTDETSTTILSSTNEFTESTAYETTEYSTTVTEISDTSTSSATEESEVTTGSGGVTSWTLASTLKPLIERRCRPRNITCAKSKFGCCPDKKTAATGPFDKGCPTPKTCEETKYGCCPDGLSPSKGVGDKGCPTIPCNETLFGCCTSDNKTAAEGNDQEGCPPPPPPCASTEFGCCEDGETEAKGPDYEGCYPTETTEATQTETHTEAQTEQETTISPLLSSSTTESSEAFSEQSSTSSPLSSSSTPAEEADCQYTAFGCCFDNKTQANGPYGEDCPCNATQYGCCPDGTTAAHGSHMEGCVMSCNTSAYGCCPDDETPAHGPDNEGCCLLSPFGCCPDNYKPAEGPHLEGCGCQYAHFGCCPDNMTIARGSHLEGCGCKYSAYGCCPDGHTESTGPNFEGCACHTYQFGCCSDGVTVAQGPNEQGCRCQQSKYQCCPDEETPAVGPNLLGCDCASSKYGCCPDGRTSAQGEKFLGCTDIPENKQAVCSLKSDRGSCSNYTVHWFYDTDYGGCVRFWYGGCEGNGNRFATREECTDVCEQPAPKDACKLAKNKGPCEHDIRRWYFDSEREVCMQFVYGGCLGNANNFETRELCQQQCEPERATDVCKLSIDPGSCAGSYARFGFDAESGRCIEFVWGGCEGNANRFKTEAACRHRCDPPGALKSACTLPQEIGSCTEKHSVWSFSQTENRCVPFYYTGCGGNNNQFDTEQDCAQSCPSSYVQDECRLPAAVGDCDNYVLKWYYDTAIKRCRQFYWGGCTGNGNNFETERECESRCSEELTTLAPTTLTITTRHATVPTRPPTAQTQPPPAPVPSIEDCFLNVEAGSCSGSEPRWAYDAERGTCLQFRYTGCGGNNNNFPTQQHCSDLCHPAQDLCQLPMRSGYCDRDEMKWFYDATTDRCSQFTYSGCDGNDNRFDTLEHCERRCKIGPPLETTRKPTPTPTTVSYVPVQCQLSSGLEPCVEGGIVWYLDTERRECVPHENAQSGYDCRIKGVFRSQEECENACSEFPGLIIAEKDPCKEPQETGNCVGYFVKWYYYEAADICYEFVYTGCGGSGNRFDTREECEGRCKKQPRPQALSTTTSSTTSTTTTTVAPQVVQDECSMPPSLSACGENSTAYYYDEGAKRCAAARIGGCGYISAHPTEEQCERRCGRFRDLDVCRYGLDPGPCRETHMKYYWDSASGTCLLFAYGGCSGSPNRFTTEEECLQVCGSRGPEHEAECADLEAECALLTCEYAVQRVRTSSGCERCTCVQVETDCSSLQLECEELKCTYDMSRTKGPDGCERCNCKDHPCAGIECSAEERCIPISYQDPLSGDIRYASECRITNKTGTCGNVENDPSLPHSCVTECHDDADCAGAAKCCERGCARVCAIPNALPPPPPPTPYTTHAPDVPHAPVVNVDTKPEVEANEGGVATLRCLFHSNPPPKITWRHGEVNIVSNVDRFRLLSDGSLEIVSLYRNDTGVYICIADNGLGIARQEIRLQVNDPVKTAASIAGDQNVVVRGVYGSPLVLNCLAYGYPPPEVVWFQGSTGRSKMVPYANQQYQARRNELLIRELNVDTIGEYTCQAYNGVGKPTSWTIVVRATEPDENAIGNYPISIITERPFLFTTTSTTTITTPLPNEITVKSYTVPVTTSLTAYPGTTVPVGGELDLPCEVDGYPVPTVTWTHNGSPIVSTNRIHTTDARLTISGVTLEDHGVYGCHARNRFSSHSSTISITVRGVFIPEYCTDNPHFANCTLIVRSRFCKHRYYSTFCCKSCAEAGQLDPQDLQLQSDAQWSK